MRNLALVWVTLYIILDFGGKNLQKTVWYEVRVGHSIIIRTVVQFIITIMVFRDESESKISEGG